MIWGLTQKPNLQSTGLQGDNPKKGPTITVRLKIEQRSGCKNIDKLTSAEKVRKG